MGKGKYAAIEKENARLKAENERIRKAFPGAVNNKVEERTRALATEKQEIEAERDRALAQNRSLGMERDKAVRQLQEQKTGEQAPHQYGGDPSHRRKRQDNPFAARCAEIEPGHSEFAC